jgi:hypothetical protein
MTIDWLDIIFTKIMDYSTIASLKVMPEMLGVLLRISDTTVLTLFDVPY